MDIRLDFVSLLLSSIGFGGLLYGFSSAGEKGWDSPYVYGPIIVGAISLIWFVVSQTKKDEPFLNFKVYQYPMFALSSVISMVVNMSLFAGMILLPIYIQTHTWHFANGCRAIDVARCTFDGRHVSIDWEIV